jgi:hypothetical protein
VAPLAARLNSPLRPFSDGIDSALTAGKLVDLHPVTAPVSAEPTNRAYLARAPVSYRAG